MEFIEVQLPSWRRPLRFHMRGVRLELRQRQMPQVDFCRRHPVMKGAFGAWIVSRTPIQKVIATVDPHQ